MNLKSQDETRNDLPAVKRYTLALSGLIALTTAGLLGAGEPVVEREAGSVRLDLGNGARLAFALDGDLLLGLNRASVDGVELTSADTVLRPVIAQEFGPDRRIVTGLRLVSATVVEGRVELRCRLLGTGDETAYRAVFVFTGDRAAAEAALPNDLTARRQAAATAGTRLAELLDQTAEVQQVRQEETAQRAILVDNAVTAEAKKKAQRWLADLELKRLPQAREKARPGLLAGVPEAAACQTAIAGYDEALGAYALEHHGRIHRDYYRFAILRQPAEICTLATTRSQAALGHEDLGELTWVIAPETRTIAGWPWKGWTQQYRLRLAGERRVNVIRQLGTWEIDGTAPGLTAVALRYRGLGRIEQVFSDDGAGAVREAWSTTEILPGAAGAAPVVSPVVPVSRNDLDRGYALRHRIGAWICRAARGGGAPFVDFQYRHHAAFITTFDRQGDWRAVSECLPGDRVLSQTDEELFPLSASHDTQPQVQLALVDPQRPFTVDELRTRWQEVDAEFRRRTAADLGFTEFPPLPGVGVIASGQPHNLLASMNDRVLDAWREQGVRLIASHSPGWVNGEIWREGRMQARHVNGGECSIQDWVPSPPVAPLWTAFQARCAARDIGYFPWLGQTTANGGPFTQRVGASRASWTLNTPDDVYGPGYEPGAVKGNLRDPAFRAEFDRCLEATFAAQGFQGFWIDSFQNLFMSQLAWSDGSGAPLQRLWWEWLAAWSRRGVATMAESHAFPGISCSVEVPGWEQDLWYFRQVWKWHRGGSMNTYSPAQLEEQCFRAMAVGGWIAPDQAYGAKAELGIPRFGEFARLYLAALPAMRRGYVLPEGRGMLWLPAEGDGEGLVFAFAEIPLPVGVTATAISEGASPATLARHTGARVRAADLCTAFGVRRGPLPDERLGRTWTAPAHTWPVPAVKESP